MDSQDGTVEDNKALHSKDSAPVSPTSWNRPPPFPKYNPTSSTSNDITTATHELRALAQPVEHIYPLQPEQVTNQPLETTGQPVLLHAPTSLRNLFQPLISLGSRNSVLAEADKVTDEHPPNYTSTWSLNDPVIATKSKPECSITVTDTDTELEHRRLRSNWSLYEVRPGQLYNLGNTKSDHKQDGSNIAATASYLTSHSWDPSYAARLGQAEGLSASGVLAAKPVIMPRLGTLKGVFLPCLQNLIGVILFVRLPWIIGMAGVGMSLVIIAMAVACTLLTTISMSAIATNGLVPSGGAYYMISRSLGKEIGVSVGVLLYVATSTGTAVFVLGAVELLVNSIAPMALVASIENCSRIYGTSLLLLLTIVSLFGMKHVNRIALLFLICAITAIAAVLIGLFASNRLLPHSLVVGFPGDLKSNFDSGLDEEDLRGRVNPEDIDFRKLFAIFFPCVTGILAGSNRSGSLKNPGKSIPRGTLTAIGVSSFTYVSFVLLFGAVCTGAFLRTKMPSDGLPIAIISWPHPMVTLVGTLLSSVGAALQCLNGAPRLLQALARDGVIPFLSFFKVTHREEPRRALLLTFLIACAGVLIGNLDAVAPITTMLYLICYAFLNASTALLSLLHYPNWRPSWRYYHWSLSCLGACLSVSYMFVINWIFATISLVLVMILYKYIEYKGAQVEWGDGMFALNLSVAQKNLLALERRQHVHVKNWRPQIMVLMDMDPNVCPPMPPAPLQMLYYLRKGGLSVVTAVVKGDYQKKAANKELQEYKDTLGLLMKEHGINGFSQVIVSHDPLAAKLTALQTVGIGVLRPNSIMLPYPSDWLNQPPTYRDNFIQLLRHINASDNAVLLFKSDRPFPPRDAKPFNTTIDVYWIMHDGGILTMLPTILRNHRLWRKAELRIFCVAQVDDDREQMKKDLEQLLKKFRIDAQALVVEMGQMDISEFTYEKTMRIQDRQDLLTEIKTSSGEAYAVLVACYRPNASAFASKETGQASDGIHENVHETQYHHSASFTASQHDLLQPPCTIVFTVQ